MNPIAVHQQAYRSATAALVAGQRLAAAAHHRLGSALGGLGAMAGDDATAADFAEAYDAAALGTHAALGELAGALATLSRLTARSAGNHLLADEAATLDRPGRHGGDPRPDADPALGDLLGVVSRVPPPCLGAGRAGSVPDLWQLVAGHLQGWAWPDADTDRLREAGGAWRRAAADVRALDGSCDDAVSGLQVQRSWEIPVALAAIADVRRLADDVARACDDLARACDDQADAVEEHRALVVGILEDLAVEVGVSVAVGAVTSFFTVGAGAAVGAAVTASRAGVAAHRVVATLRGLQASAHLRTVTPLGRTVDDLGPVRSRLQRFDVDDATDGAGVALRTVDDVPSWRHLPPKIEYTWDEVVQYRTGPATPMEHIRRGHWPDSTLPGKGRFHEGITEEQLMDYVDEAVRRGEVSPTDGGTVNYDLGQRIGTDERGQPATTLRVHVRDGVVHSAYPVRAP